jgi:hypothetical protein
MTAEIQVSPGDVNIAPVVDYADIEQIVQANLFPSASVELWRRLTQSDMVGTVYRVLVAMQVKVDADLATRRAEFDGTQDWQPGRVRHDDWRRRALLFKKAVQVRIIQVKPMIRQANVDQADSRTNREYYVTRSTAMTLARAIYAHRKDLLAEDEEPSSFDRALWSILSTVELPAGEGLATVESILGSAA